MQPSDFITPVSGLQYFICMIDFGRGRIRPQGFGADVAPEYTRRQIVEEVRDSIERGRRIVHIKFVDGNDMTDITHEIVAEALASQAEYDAENGRLDAIHDRMLAEQDHNRDLRKHAVV